MELLGIRKIEMGIEKPTGWNRNLETLQKKIT